jgi:hypothetical protein
MESHGEKPAIQAAVWRTPAEQAALKKAGKSTVSYSFHTVTSKTGQAESLAADFADYYRGYNVPNSFWLKLLSSAQSHDMTTGVYWGLSQSNRNKITQLVQSRAWTLPYSRGWDAGHVEPQPWVITLSQAKAGKRPPVPK